MSRRFFALSYHVTMAKDKWDPDKAFILTPLIYITDKGAKKFHPNDWIIKNW